MNNKIFIIILILLTFSTFTNALVIEDLGDQVQEVNDQIIQSNALIQAEVSQLRNQIELLKSEIITTRDNSIRKEDLEQVFETIEYLQAKHLANVLTLLLAVVFFSFAVLFLAKGKRWI